VYSWGAGECGQLGTGRCTRREILCPVFIKEAATDSPVQSLFQDVAAGDGHAVAVTADGQLYSWGLNQCAQLGLGHYQAKHFPQRVDLFLRKVMLEDDENMNQCEISRPILTKAFAGGHSSGRTACALIAHLHLIWSTMFDARILFSYSGYRREGSAVHLGQHRPRPADASFTQAAAGPYAGGCHPGVGISRIVAC